MKTPRLEGCLAFNLLTALEETAIIWGSWLSFMLHFFQAHATHGVITPLRPPMLSSLPKTTGGFSLFLTLSCFSEQRGDNTLPVAVFVSDL